MHKFLKRMLCLMLALTLCCALAACGAEEHKDKESSGNTTQNVDDKNTQQSDTQENADDPQTKDPETEDPKSEDPDTEEPETEKPGTEEPETNTPQPETPKAEDPKPETPVVSTQVPQQGAFDNAAFIGDSVTLKLRNYNTKNAVLGKATFLCQGSYSVAHAVNNTMYLSYQGQDTTPQDALAACGADKVFILLGMNDIALWGIDTTIENWGKLITNIRAKCPDIDIYIQSGTPIYTGGEKGKLNNANMNAYNVRLQEFAQQNGCHYVDVNTPFKDSTGGLAKAYCSDEYVHFTDAACALWVDILAKL